VLIPDRLVAREVRDGASHLAHPLVESA
jgi:hypothetical protein